MSRRASLILRTVLCAGVACSFVALACTPSLAQQQQLPPSNDPRDPANQETFNRRDLRDREASLRTRVGKEIEVGSARRMELALKRAAEDFERIQVANNDLLRLFREASTSNALDYKQSARLTDEVRKRAERLKEDLAFPEVDEKDKQKAREDEGALDAAGVRDSILRLDQLIVGFVNNPIFRSKTPVVEARLASEAARDLDAIIDLSGVIKKAADRLNKTNGRPR